MRRSAAWISFFACVVFASLAMADLVEERAPAPPRPAGPERYRVIGRPAGDGCGGRIYLATRTITLHAQTMLADVVDRTYTLRREGPRLIASGRFRSNAACDGTHIRERWELRRVDADTLEGRLDSTWQLPPSCTECTITFRLRAIRVGSNR